MTDGGVARKRLRTVGALVLLLVTTGLTSAVATAPGRATTGNPPGAARATATTPAAAAAASPAAPRWRPCGRLYPGYDCATVTVPLDHDRPAGATTRIALARYRATDEQRRIGSVFVNPGGPGGSGVELVLAGFGELMGTRLGGRFDVVGFDPRGVAGSDPLHCFASERALVRYFTGLPVFPYRAGQFRTFFNRYSGLAAECLDDRQRVARHMSTADVARDLDLLRRAVGDRRLTYFGVSYGSYLGTTYANLFPGRVRALAIDGVLDPRLWSAGWQIASDRVATQLEFDEFLRLCDAAGPQCAFRTPAGSALRWERLARTIRRDPLELPGDFVYTYDYLITDAAVAMYAPEVWGGPGGAAALFDYLADAALAGNARAAEEVARLRARLVEQLSLDVEPVREADYPNGWPDAYYGNHCADAQYPRSFPTWLAIDRYARLGSRFGPFWWWGAAGCARWPLSPDRYAGPWRARTSAPVLVVGNYFDGITAYDGAVAVDRLLRNSRLLSYAGWGHTAYLRSECVTRRVDAYLLRGALPPRGAVCRANPNPFLAAPGRQAAKGALLVGLPPAGHLRR